MPAANYDDILARYKRMRSLGRELNNCLPEYVPKEGIEAAGRKLGLWVRGTLVFDNEDQACVLFDHAIHGCFKDGKNAVDRYVAEQAPAPGSDEEVLLAAMRRTFFSLFRVEEVVKGVGTRVLDIFQDREYFLADVNFSLVAAVGRTLASRVILFEDFIMTTGAGLPVDLDAMKEVARYIEKMAKARQDESGMTREENAEMAAELIRLCLGSAGAPPIEYREIDETPDDWVVPLEAPASVGRNDPCPCGSGKK
ncbi:MAG: SEC-C metal-binding domain-containing protein, partial [Planctomycetota bacterium]|nr:SEC-C metal-binding domain-containing protein [Planctomycetota bacterium]